VLAAQHKGFPSGVLRHRVVEHRGHVNQIVRPRADAAGGNLQESKNLTVMFPICLPKIGASRQVRRESARFTVRLTQTIAVASD
jgi:hypothetical protein